MFRIIFRVTVEKKAGGNSLKEYLNLIKQIITEQPHVI